MRPQILLAAGLIVLGVATRLAPYVVHLAGLGDINDPNGMPWNVSPIGAICLFGGACLADRRWAYAVPLAAMVLSDVGIGLLMGQVGFGFHPMIPLVYGTFAFMVWAGGWLRENLSRLPGILARIAAIAGTAVLAEVVFFLVTNFGDWVFQPGVVPGGSPTYPHTPAGLAACYIAALPFFGKSLSGMAVYATLLFGGYELLAHRAFAPQPSVLVDARPTS